MVEYRGIPKNELSFKKDAMVIDVDQSAAPIVHKFPETQFVKSVHFEAQLEGSLNYHSLKAGAEQADDFPLRVGLVVEGEETLSFAKKLISPSWVKQLFELSGKDKGIDHILFLNVTTQDNAAFEKRVHPLSDYLKERVVGQFQDGRVDVKYELEKALPVAALWISSDGDDTQSKFKIKINKLSLRKSPDRP